VSAARPALVAVPALAAALALGGAAGCVPKREYDKVVADAATVRAAAEARQKEDAANAQALQERLAAAEAATQDREAKLSELSTTSHNLQSQLDEATAINQQLRGELQRLGKDVDKILADRGTISKALDDARARLDELRKAQAAAEARTALFRDWQQRFHALIDAGQLRVESRRGRLVMNVSGDLLFDAGKTELRTAGKGALMEIAHALQTSGPGKRFLVTAHVDEDPPPAKGKRARSTWELTTARAVTVVEYFVSLGVPGESLTAAGAGSFDALGPSDSADARARNRRVEIALLPSVEEVLPPPQAAR
jgi:chemotaxis protein MotB